MCAGGGNKNVCITAYKIIPSCIDIICKGEWSTVNNVYTYIHKSVWAETDTHMHSIANNMVAISMP